MLLNLTERSSVPLHEQIIHQITEKIVEGDLIAGEKLPNDRALARTAHVNAGTVKRAYTILERDGLIHKAKDHFTVASLTLDQKQAIAFRHNLDNQSPLNIIDQFSKKLISVFEVETLQNIFRELMKNTFGIPDLYFGTWDEKGKASKLSPTPSDSTSLDITGRDELLFKIMDSKIPIRLDPQDEAHEKSDLQFGLIKRSIRIILPLWDADRFLGYMAVPQTDHTRELTEDEMDLLGILAHQFVTALTTSRLYSEAMANRRMETELQMARQIQTGLLPKSMPNNGRFTTATYIQPSRAVGGDFYDCIKLDDHRYAFIIADACGDGLPAAMLISQVQGMLRSELLNGNDIQLTLTNVNQQIMGFTPKDKFITLFLSIFDASNQTLTYASAGHDYPVRVDGKGNFCRLQTGGPALGLMENASFDIETIQLNDGDNVLFYTDGLTEAMNSKREIYGEERLAKSLSHHRSESAKALVLFITKDIESFVGTDSTPDDRTMMILKIHENR